MQEIKVAYINYYYFIVIIVVIIVIIEHKIYKYCNFTKMF